MPISPIASPNSSGAPSLLDAAREWAENVNFSSPGFDRKAVARTKAAETGPPAVQRAFALYSSWQDRDLGAVRLLRGDFWGRTVYAIRTTTDSDDMLLELYSGRGSVLGSGVIGADGKIRWDEVPLAVRDRVAPKAGGAPSVVEYREAIAAAQDPGTTAGSKIGTDEAKAAARRLLGTELSLASIDGEENAALRRTLADAEPMTDAARTYLLRLSTLQATGVFKDLREPRSKPLAEWIGASPFADAATLSSAQVKGRKDAPRASAFGQLVRAAHGWHATQLAPATAREAEAVLRAAGASPKEAAQTVAALSRNGALLFTGVVFSHDAASSNDVPTREGLAVFASTKDGKRISAVVAPIAPPDPVSLQGAIQAITGVDRVPDEVVLAAPGLWDVEWRPIGVGALKAQIDLRDPAKPKVAAITLPPEDRALRQLLEADLTQALGAPTEVLGWVGRDNADGPGNVAAHRPVGANGPITLSEIRVRPDFDNNGRIVTVTAKRLGVGQGDQTLGQDLALILARRHAAATVADPQIGDDARLEVALRTLYASAGDLVRLNAEDSPVGFNPAVDRAQWMLPSVWGGNAVIVTHKKNGTLTVEDQD
jgi:hypothetical protein